MRPRLLFQKSKLIRKVRHEGLRLCHLQKRKPICGALDGVHGGGGRGGGPGHRLHGRYGGEPAGGGGAGDGGALRPWRFDTARNRSLDLVPEDADICVCTDLDEVLHPGWRALLEAAWVPGTTWATYRYTWNFLPDGREGHVFGTARCTPATATAGPTPCMRCSPRTRAWWSTWSPCRGCSWTTTRTSKSRAQYLPLLELSVQEDPEDDRNMHYLGREYMFRGQWERPSPP